MQHCDKIEKPPLKILLVAEPGVDGVFRHVEALATHLLKHHHQVSLAYSTRRGSDRLQSLVRLVERHNGNAFDLKVGNKPELRDIGALWSLWQMIRVLQPDVVHSHSSKAGGLVRILMAIMGRSSHSFYTPNAYFGLGREGGLRTSFYNGVERLLGGVGTTINVSADESYFARETLRLDPARLRLIGNGVDTEKFRPVDTLTRDRLRSDYGIPVQARVLGTVGRFSRQKDYGTLYRALLPVMQRHKELHFVHLGAKGSLASDEAKRLLSEGRLTVIEYLAEPLPIYQLMDGFILTSLYEGLSYAVLEALSCDLPVILSNAPGNRDFLRHSLSHAWFAEVGKVDEFSAAIEAWQIALDVRRPSNHRAVAAQWYSEAGCGDAIIGLYQAAREGLGSF